MLKNISNSRNETKFKRSLEVLSSRKLIKKRGIVDFSKDYEIFNDWVSNCLSNIVWTTKNDITRYLWLELTEEEHSKYVEEWESLFKY